ncbi:MAG: ATP-binding protein [Bacteroidales bacterium]|nr:ATP-binding protein [Bacteroidales bacterium]
MRKLPIGIQEFRKLQEDDYIYVDKTRIIYDLLKVSHYNFLSRPRRFGKSLLINTLKELFLGNRELFKGLWIYDKLTDWYSYPVIKISFSNIGHKSLGLEAAIENRLDSIANEYNITLTQQVYPLKFDELIRKMAGDRRTVILIDEYDKPIIDYMEDIAMAEKNRDILKNFYSVIKDADSYIRFFMVTGVSKFSQVSIFSDLNNLFDITLDDRYSTLLGWTEEEVQSYFPEYIAQVQEKFRGIYDDVMPVIREWYNGFSWDGVNHLYNPVSMMNLFSKRDFRNYWFTTGTPTFLMKQIKKENYTAFDIEDSYVTTDVLDKYEIGDISLISLLFQTGYLTVKEYDSRRGRIKLDYPNREVEEAFSTHILTELTEGKLDKTTGLLFEMADSLEQKDLETFIAQLNTLFSGISYSLVIQQEKYFHSLFYLVMKLVGYQIDTEVLTIKGRIDAVVQTQSDVFIIEFKINQPSEKAIAQIRKKQYPQKYFSGKKPVTLVGINFDTKNSFIDDYRVEEA